MMLTGKGGVLGQAAKFASVGAVSTLASIAIYAALRGWLSPMTANVVAVTVTTVAGSELHRRFTFGGARAAGGRMLVQNVVSGVWACSSSSLGLFLVASLVATPTVDQESAVLLAMSVIGGLARFAALRLWVFGVRARGLRTRRPGLGFGFGPARWSGVAQRLANLDLIPSTAAQRS
ncbi:GtrA family protein [Saccharothrix deserti]|uniref:GtrA family protein n=1 Tax=Saccharothrix deserti TaxID=2593674 RepID=UPI00131D4275|nr:GtrA family protein [Saccharothrix deserti]